jgi:membrane fusion protein (multidrug efflux system)
MVRATESVQLSVENGGIITRVLASSGQTVTQGQVFLQIDDSQEQAELTAVRAQIALAELDVERAQTLVKQRATGQQTLDRAKAELNVVRAQEKALQAVINKKQVRVPFTGRLGFHQLQVGQFLEANTPLVDLVSISQERWVDFTIPADKRTWLNSVTIITDDLQVSSDSVTVANSIDNITRKLPIRATVSNEQLIPGEIVRVSLASPQSQSVFIIPNTALRFDAIGSYVFVLNTEGEQTRAKRVDVTILSQGQQTSVIDATLPSGTKIADIGSFKLREGILVNIAMNETIAERAL